MLHWPKLDQFLSRDFLSSYCHHTSRANSVSQFLKPSVLSLTAQSSQGGQRQISVFRSVVFCKHISCYGVSPGIAGLDCEELWGNADDCIWCPKPVFLWLSTSAVQSAHKTIFWPPLTASMQIKCISWIPEGGHLWAPLHNRTQEGEVAVWGPSALQ